MGKSATAETELEVITALQVAPRPFIPNDLAHGMISRGPSSITWSREPATDPRCYSPGVVADTYHVDAEATFTLPKEMWFIVPAGDKVTEVELTDNDAYSNAEIHLSPSA